MCMYISCSSAAFAQCVSDLCFWTARLRGIQILWKMGIECITVEPVPCISLCGTVPFSPLAHETKLQTVCH